MMKVTPTTVWPLPSRLWIFVPTRNCDFRSWTLSINYRCLSKNNIKCWSGQGSKQQHLARFHFQPADGLMINSVGLQVSVTFSTATQFANKADLVGFLLDLAQFSLLSILRFGSSSAVWLEEALFSQEILNSSLFRIRVRWVTRIILMISSLKRWLNKAYTIGLMEELNMMSVEEMTWVAFPSASFEENTNGV